MGRTLSWRVSGFSNQPVISDELCAKPCDELVWLRTVLGTVRAQAQIINRKMCGTDGMSRFANQRMRLQRTERSRLQKENVCSQTFRPTIRIKMLLAIFEIFDCRGSFACLAMRSSHTRTRRVRCAYELIGHQTAGTVKQ